MKNIRKIFVVGLKGGIGKSFISYKVLPYLFEKATLIELSFIKETHDYHKYAHVNYTKNHDISEWRDILIDAFYDAEEDFAKIIIDVADMQDSYRVLYEMITIHSREDDMLFILPFIDNNSFLMNLNMCKYIQKHLKNANILFVFNKIPIRNHRKLSKDDIVRIMKNAKIDTSESINNINFSYIRMVNKKNNISKELDKEYVAHLFEKIRNFDKVENITI